MSVIEKIINILVPHECLNCTAESAVLCIPCQSTLPHPDLRCYRCRRETTVGLLCTTCSKSMPLDDLFVRASYQGVAKEIVHALKFERKRSAADDIGTMLAALIPPGSATLVMPLPTATPRIRQRGYDQAEQIAKRLAVITHTPVDLSLRRQGSERQVGQTRSTRLRQLQGRFYVARETRIAGHDILLVDDVLTTGASIEAAAAALRAAGARSVTGVVFAVA